MADMREISCMSTVTMRYEDVGKRVSVDVRVGTCAGMSGAVREDVSVSIRTRVGESAGLSVGVTVSMRERASVFMSI